jgi:prepilin-type N-terminal cleavage/methylation domain-containing protein
MRLLARRGYTLIELLIALVLLGMVSTAIYKVLVNNQRIYLAQTQQIDLQQNIRAAAAILPAEFRQIDAADSDITAMGPDSIRARVIRQVSFLCVAPVLGGGVGQITLTVRQTPIYGTRTTFTANDSLLVYYEGDPTRRSDDSWLRGQVKTVTALSSGCAGPSPHDAFVITLDPNWIAGTQANVPGVITTGSPILGFDKVVYRVYQSSDNNWYLGIRSPASTGTIQPLVGPLTGPDGVTFSYFDANGAVTTDPTRVARIDIALRARTVSPIRDVSGAITYKVDSVLTSVALRNNPRCGPGSFPATLCQ